MNDVITPDRIARWQDELAEASAGELLLWASASFGKRIALASSLGLEDQILTDMIAWLQLPIPIFTLDTGRLFPETHDLLQRTTDRYGWPIRVFYPDASATEEMATTEGVNSFQRSVELRKHCCHVRKVEPLQRALANLDGWICGLRREQAVTRTGLQKIEWDGANGRVKLNPLADWSEAKARDYIGEHHVPINPLHEQGFPSIGCACCTRAIEPGEDLRAGRWWWESPEEKECGLHLKDGLLGRKT